MSSFFKLPIILLILQRKTSFFYFEMSTYQGVIVRFRCITVILFLFALLFSLNGKAQDSVVLNVPYTIKTDTITRIDTTYIIDTIIKPVQYIKIDTVFFQSDHDTVTKAKT